jgi:hypothetical protein
MSVRKKGKQQTRGEGKSDGLLIALSLIPFSEVKRT